MIDLSQWKSTLVKPVLTSFATATGLSGKIDATWAINQIVGTTKESGGCTYLVQLNGGPAVGFYQMEPATHDDIWLNFLKYQPKLTSALEQVVGRTTMGVGSAEEMVGDLTYATLMCRIDYYRSPLAAPANTAVALAGYHKQIYNSALGASVVADDISYYQQAIDA
jgi:hypothetical protein